MAYRQHRHSTGNSLNGATVIIIASRAQPTALNNCTALLASTTANTLRSLRNFMSSIATRAQQHASARQEGQPGPQATSNRTIPLLPQSDPCGQHIISKKTICHLRADLPPTGASPCPQHCAGEHSVLTACSHCHQRPPPTSMASTESLLECHLSYGITDLRLSP